MENGGQATGGNQHTKRKSREHHAERQAITGHSLFLLFALPYLIGLWGGIGKAGNGVRHIGLWCGCPLKFPFSLEKAGLHRRWRAPPESVLYLSWRSIFYGQASWMVNNELPTLEGLPLEDVGNS